MTTAEKPTRIVTAIIKSKAEETWHTVDGEVHEGFTIGLEVPEFRSKFPTICTRVGPELAAHLKLEQTLRLRLEQQSLKKGKDGAFPSHYYWGLLGIATKQEIQIAAAIMQNGETSKNAGVAMRYAVDLVMADKVELGQLESMALRIYRAMETLHTGTVAESTEAVPNSPTEPSIHRTPKAATPNSEPETPLCPEVSTATVPPKPEIPKFPNKGVFLTWAYKAYGRTSSELQAEFEKHGQACTFDQKAAEVLIGWWGVTPPKP